MGVVGSAALGLVLGWVCCLVARGTRGATGGVLGISWRALAFSTAMFAGAAALALFQVGSSGALTTSIGFGIGALVASIALGNRQAASPINRNGG